VLGHAFDGLGVQRVVAGTAAANRASCWLLERLGFTRVGEGETSFATTPDGAPITFLGCTYELPRFRWHPGAA
jgi:RimJ/RimL family protein N-acetyltransferase